MVANQTMYSRLEQRSVIKILEAGKCKPCETYRRMGNVYDEASLVKKMFTNWLNIGLPQWVWDKKTVHEEETHWLSSKEEVWGTVVCKESHTVSFGTWKEPWWLICLKKV